MKYRQELFAPEDVESGIRYVTSPVSGNTYRLAGGRRPLLALHIGLWLEGVRNFRRETIDPIAFAQDFALNSSVSLALAPQHHDYLEALWNELERTCGQAPLRDVAARIAAIRRAEPTVSVEAALSLAHGMKTKGRTNCLLHSFWQAGLLRYFGVPCCLYIGVWMPMTDAHAWVLAPARSGLVVLGDSVDRVMHYAPTLVFEFGADSADFYLGRNSPVCQGN